MNCEEAQLLLVDLEDGRLKPDERDALQAHLDSCEACTRELASVREFLPALHRTDPEPPSSGLRDKFQEWFEVEQEALVGRNVVPFSIRARRVHPALLSVGAAVAACAIFVVGTTVGERSLSAVLDSERAVTARELADLRERIELVDRTVALSIRQQDTASDRLRTLLALDHANMRPQVVEELLAVLAYDRSSSVRLSAVEALLPHVSEAGVTTAIAGALSREPSPLVQVAMIDLLATTRKPAAAAALQQFIISESPLEPVRDAARYALAGM